MFPKSSKLGTRFGLTAMAVAFCAAFIAFLVTLGLSGWTIDISKTMGIIVLELLVFSILLLILFISFFMIARETRQEKNKTKEEEIAGSDDIIPKSKM